jgi:UrcA family protein
MKTHVRLSLIATAAGLFATATLATGSARAAIQGSVTRSMTLRYDPRDLNTDKGADRLLSRISGAATKVCDEGGSIAQLIESSGYRDCRHAAIARAVADVNRPTVTSAYNRHFGEREKGLRAAVEAPRAILLHLVAVD